MEKYLRVGFFFLVSLFLVSCTAKKETIEVRKKEIDKKLIHTLVGSWVANSYDYGNYEIIYDAKGLTFNSTKLEIEYTKGNRVFTHEENDKASRYIFEVKEEEIIVFPSYEVKQSGDELAKGGDLAPIELRKTQRISKESILGSWRSIEPDFPVYIQVRATFVPNEVDLLISKSEHAEEIETIPLTFESGESELTYVNKEGTIRYSFSYYEETKMLLTSSSTKEGTEGTARPWILERVIH
ncbi:hypothetical protein [Candidatus Enterococcus mansonii]|uniref:Uncharacterized protein n=1 Tax=Candidatus Enterococcus mansonii TaxID=1834181 RepID=A0A242CI15_9ENTE|nr:hypothetical protein [Enterococcus sp. 4G2_DIV0659]OTO09884.1 hypothetical protein A5880_000567 [Enterococcus sp. 4G2_DIV0659]